MKLKYGVIVSLLFLMTLLSSCLSPESIAKQSTWQIIQSPLTGKYYEVIITFWAGSSAGLMGISEVTKSEYDKYIAEKSSRGY